MKTTRIMVAVMLTAVCCTEVASQVQRSTDSSLNQIKIDYTVPVTNINFSQGPQLLSDNSVKFTVRAPEAKKVQVDLGGIKYDMEKGDDGIWTV